jgi:hypothetical protein
MTQIERNYANVGWSARRRHGAEDERAARWKKNTFEKK